MELKNYKDLDLLMSVCRKRGVKAVRVGDVHIEFNDEPTPTKRRSRKLATTSLGDINEHIIIPTVDGPSEEELLYYSAGMSADGES